MKLVVSLDAQKALDDLPRRERERLIEKAQAFATDPFAPHPWASPMRGRPNQVRVRQGDHRGLLLIVRALDTVILERVAFRKEVYR